MPWIADRNRKRNGNVDLRQKVEALTGFQFIRDIRAFRGPCTEYRMPNGLRPVGPPTFVAPAGFIIGSVQSRTRATPRCRVCWQAALSIELGLKFPAVMSQQNRCQARVEL